MWNLSGQVHDDKDQSFDEEKLMLQNPLHWHLLTQELYTDTAAKQTP